MSGKKQFDVERFFAALADKTRLRLLNLMRDGEVCVCFFAETLGTNNPKISRHLAYLRSAGLVEGRRDGKWIHYRITEPANAEAAEVFSATLKMMAGDPEMQADITRLVAVCCRPAAPVSIKRNKIKA
jgi:ArsR family transcriptional regulator, arsenate/arsenite/antimonite-responsive transcriptional repressor